MRDYGKVHTSFWTSSNIRAMSEDGRALALYLLTCPHGTIAGVFRLPDGYACEDLQWSSERVSEGFAELLNNGFANRCETTKWVFICKHFQWNPPENPNQKKAAIKCASMVPDECCWKSLYISVLNDFLGEDLAVSITVTEGFQKGSLTSSSNSSSNSKQEPPIAPQGGQSVGNDADASENQKHRQSAEKKVTFSKWIDEVRANGEKAVSDYAPVWKYADDCKLPYEFIELAWVGFKDYYHLGLGSGKRQADWRLTFLNNVKKNYQKLWFWSEKDNKWTLTTAGVQADRAAEVAA